MTKKTVTYVVKSEIGGAVKDTEKLSAANKELKEDITDVNTSAKASIKDFSLFGISINGVKLAFKKMGAASKLAFGSIRAGMISTGVGALIVAVGSLVAYFLSTERGARKLEVAFSGIGAVINVLLDRISGFGEILAGIFDRPLFESLKMTKDNFSGINKELQEEVRLTMALTRSNQALKDSQLALNLETAKSRSAIEKYKKDAEDVTKSIEARTRAAQKGYNLETKLLNKQLDLKQKEIDNAQALVDMSESSFADLEALTGLKIEFFELEQQSTTKQIELQNKKNALEKEAQAIVLEAIAKRKEEEAQKVQDEEDARVDKLKKEQSYLDALEDIYSQADRSMVEMSYEALQTAEYNRHEQYLKSVELMENEEHEKNALRLAAGEVHIGNIKALAQMEQKIQEDKTKAIQFASMDLAQALMGLAGENKMLASASVVIDTAKGVMKAYGQTGALGHIGAAVVVANGLKSLQTINATPIQAPSTSLGGGLSSAVKDATPVPPSPSMMSQGLQINNPNAERPIETYVVTDSMSKSQHRLNKIRNRATL